MNVVRAVSTEGFGRIRYHTEVRRRLDSDRGLRAFFEGETDEVPGFYQERMRRDLGPLLHQFLPEGALVHDPNAYLNSQLDSEPVSLVRLA
jgi:hypothetical protein